MKLEKKYLLGIIGLIVILLTGVSYAYFKARINGDPKSIVIKSKGVYLEYKGDTTLSSGEIGPGWSVTKTFTVENQGSNTEKYDIYIEDLVNTFVTTGNLQYKITSSTGYNMTEFKDIPKSETATDTVLAYSVSIDAGVTQSYTITLKYNDTDDEQSGDMRKKFSGTLGIKIGTVNSVNLAYTIIEKSSNNEDDIYNENGYRYEGSNPNNYIYMTNKSTNEQELWRIIGVFPDGENGENIIRVRKYYTLDNYPTMVYNNGSFASTYWPDTKIYSTLSNTYTNSNYENTVNFKMYLGASSSYTTYTSDDLFKMERALESKGEAVPDSNGTLTFNGTVGLIYSSDYGYGVKAVDCSRTLQLYSGGYDGNENCYNKNWLYQGQSTLQWLISPSRSVGFSVFTVDSNGSINNLYNVISQSYAYSPVMALNTDIQVTGSGTYDNPYIIN